MQIKAIELIPRCTHCYGDSPKAYEMEQVQATTKSASEYQAAYRHWPWHPRIPSMKPEQKKLSAEKSKSHMERKSIYGIDYTPQTNSKPMSPKKHKSKEKVQMAEQTDDTVSVRYFPKKAVMSRLGSPNVMNAEVIHPSNNQPFQNDTIYSVAYTKYDPDVIKATRQPPIKIKDNMEIKSKARLAMPKSTAKDDYIHHKDAERPVPIRPKENSGYATGPIDEATQYDYYIEHPIDSHMYKAKMEPKFEAISTAMADFTKPENFEKPTPCPPPVSNHFVTGKFDGTTTFNTAYKPFPVQRYELPIWAKKPTYKRPTGGMITNSLYKHDYRDPEMIKKPAPINPNMFKNVIIKMDKADRRFEETSTYKNDFRVWEDVFPRETYKVIEVYQPPKEKMVCETNHRADFQGSRADKMKPCRHSSQHRELNMDTDDMTFVTTYTEDFRNPRPRSTPSSGSVVNSSEEKRAGSAGAPKTAPPVTSNKIPTPDLSSRSASEMDKPDTATNNSAVNDCKGHVDILKITHPGNECKLCARHKCGSELDKA